MNYEAVYRTAPATPYTGSVNDAYEIGIFDLLPKQSFVVPDMGGK